MRGVELVRTGCASKTLNHSFHARGLALHRLNRLGILMNKHSLYPHEVNRRFTYCPDTGHVCCTSTGKKVGTVNNWGYINHYFNRRVFKQHRIIWLMVTGSWPDGHIDHINGNRTDNRWSNLRVVSLKENNQNQWKPQKTNSIGFRGVRVCGGRFRSTITVDGKRINLGRFNTAEEAGHAYLDAKKRLHAGCMYAAS